MISLLRSIKPTFLLLLFLWGILGNLSRIVAQQPTANLPTTPAEANISLPTPSAEEGISIQFPHTSVAEVLTVYEKLTGKRLIRDSNLAGPELSIMVADPIPRKEAISLIESSLLLNGYTVVPVDEKTVKILGPSRPPRSEGLPLYLEESQLPQDGDKIVSFYSSYPLPRRPPSSMALSKETPTARLFRSPMQARLSSPTRPRLSARRLPF